MIDIERPLQRAWARMNARLFSTFEFKRWLSLGFVAWLAAFLTGGGGSLNLPWWGNSSGAQANPQEWLGSLDPGPVILLVCGGVLVVGLILIAMMWIGSRAQFLFLDNVLRDRAEVRAPWREFGARGHRFFVFYTWAASIPVVLALLVVFAALLVFWPELISFTWPGWPRVMPWLAVLVVLSLLSLVWSVAMLFYRDFGVPILYASDCTAGEAFSQVWAIARAKRATARSICSCELGSRWCSACWPMRWCCSPAAWADCRIFIACSRCPSRCFDRASCSIASRNSSPNTRSGATRRRHSTAPCRKIQARGEVSSTSSSRTRLRSRSA